MKFSIETKNNHFKDVEAFSNNKWSEIEKLNNDFQTTHYFGNKKIDSRKTLNELNIKNGSKITLLKTFTNNFMGQKKVFVLCNTNWTGKIINFIKPHFFSKIDSIKSKNGRLYRVKKLVNIQNSNRQKQSFIIRVLPVILIILFSITICVFTKNYQYLFFSFFSVIGIVSFFLENKKNKIDIDCSDAWFENNTIENNVSQITVPGFQNIKMKHGDIYYFNGPFAKNTCLSLFALLCSKGYYLNIIDEKVFRWLSNGEINIKIFNHDVQKNNNCISIVIGKNGENGKTFHTLFYKTGIVKLKIGLNPQKKISLLGSKSIDDITRKIASQTIAEFESLSLQDIINNVNGTNVPIGSSFNNSIVGVDFKNDGSHMLIAGTTGSGKSVLIKNIILSLCFNNDPDTLKIIGIDYKGEDTFKDFSQLPHFSYPICSDLNINETERILNLLQSEIKKREKLSVENKSFPHLFVIVDEFAQLVQNTSTISSLKNIAVLGRSLKIHLILSTQKPAGIVSKELLSNIGIKICFKTTNSTDSFDVVDTDKAYKIKNAGEGYLLTQKLNSAMFFKGFSMNPVANKPRLVNEFNWNSKNENENFSIAPAIKKIIDKYPIKSVNIWPLSLANVIESNKYFAMIDEPLKQKQYKINFEFNNNTLITGGAKSGISSTCATICNLLLCKDKKVSVISNNISLFKKFLPNKNFLNLIPVHEKVLVYQLLNLCKTLENHILVFDDFDLFNSYEPANELIYCPHILTMKNVSIQLLNHYPTQIIHKSENPSNELLLEKYLLNRLSRPGEAIYKNNNRSKFCQIFMINKYKSTKVNAINTVKDNKIKALPKKIIYKMNSGIGIGGIFAKKIFTINEKNNFSNIGIFGNEKSGKTNTLNVIRNQFIENNHIEKSKICNLSSNIDNFWEELSVKLNDEKIIFVDNIDNAGNVPVGYKIKKGALICTINDNSYSYIKLFKTKILLNPNKYLAQEILESNLEKYIDQIQPKGRGFIKHNGIIEQIQIYLKNT